MKKLVHVVLAVAAVVVIVIGTVRRWPWVHDGWTWLDGFARTPGFGALAAVVAAAIAYRAATVRIRHDRDAEKTRREAEVVSAGAQRRWEMLMWVYENSGTVDPDRLAGVCNALEDQLATPLEKGLLGVIVSEITEPGDSATEDTAEGENRDGAFRTPSDSGADFAVKSGGEVWRYKLKRRPGEMSPETRTRFVYLLERLDEREHDEDR